MQRTNERQKTNGNAKEKKEMRIMVQTSHLGYGKLQMAFCRSLAEQIDKSICDDAEQIILPKKKRKRKKGFNREITRVEGFKPSY